MSDKQPEALRLADELDLRFVDSKAAAELRRLHAENAQLAADRARVCSKADEVDAENDRLHALCEKQKMLLEQARDALRRAEENESWISKRAQRIEACSAITNHLRQHEGEKHE